MTARTMKLHLISWPAWIGWPWGILALVFALNLALHGAVEEPAGDDDATGALIAIYVTAAVGYTQAMTQVLPFAAALGVTRRRFLTATGLFVLVQSLAFGRVLYLLSLPEDATDGWGQSLQFFAVDGFVHDNPLAQARY